MDFVALVDQVIALLRQRGRVTYRTLQETSPALLWLLGALPDDSPFRTLEAPQRRQRALEGLKRMLLRESQVQPPPPGRLAPAAVGVDTAETPGSSCSCGVGFQGVPARSLNRLWGEKLVVCGGVESR